MKNLILFKQINVLMNSLEKVALKHRFKNFEGKKTKKENPQIINYNS